MASNDVTTHLLKIAEGLDKLASSIEEDARVATEKVASAPSPVDYGTLGRQSAPQNGEQAFTSWLLS